MEQFGSQSLVSHHILLCYICYVTAGCDGLKLWIRNTVAPYIVRREQTTAAVIFVQLV